MNAFLMLVVACFVARAEVFLMVFPRRGLARMRIEVEMMAPMRFIGLSWVSGVFNIMVARSIQYVNHVNVQKKGTYQICLQSRSMFSIVVMGFVVVWGRALSFRFRMGFLARLTTLITNFQRIYFRGIILKRFMN